MPSRRYRWDAGRQTQARGAGGPSERSRAEQAGTLGARTRPAASIRARPPKISDTLRKCLGGPSKRLHCLRRRRELREEPLGCSGGAARRGFSPRAGVTPGRGVIYHFGNVGLQREVRGGARTCAHCASAQICAPFGVGQVFGGRVFNCARALRAFAAQHAKTARASDVSSTSTGLFLGGVVALLLYANKPLGAPAARCA